MDGQSKLFILSSLSFKSLCLHLCWLDLSHFWHGIQSQNQLLSYFHMMSVYSEQYEFTNTQGKKWLSTMNKFNHHHRIPNNCTWRWDDDDDDALLSPWMRLVTLLLLLHIYIRTCKSHTTHKIYAYYFAYVGTWWYNMNCLVCWHTYNEYATHICMNNIRIFTKTTHSKGSEFRLLYFGCIFAQTEYKTFVGFYYENVLTWKYLSFTLKNPETHNTWMGSGNLLLFVHHICWSVTKVVNDLKTNFRKILPKILW